MDNKILVKVKADITDLNQKLDSAGKNLDKWSKDTTGGFISLYKSIGMFALRLAGATAPITAAGAAIFAMMQKTANTGEELLRMKQKTGMTVEELYNLKQVVEFSDVSLGELDLRLKDLARNLFEARNKAGEARDIFRALGIDTSKSLNQVLIDLAKRFAEMEDGEVKLALVTQLFGRNGQDIIPVLNDIASGAHKVAGAFSEEAAKSAAEFNDNITELKQNIASLRNTMANVLIPVVNDFFKPRPKSGTLEDIDEQIKRTKELISLREKWANPEAVRDMLNELANLEDKRAFIAGLFEDEGASAKTPAPMIITDEDRKKYVDNEQNMAKLVDDAGQKIIDNLNKRAEAYKKLQEQQQTAREAAIQLQLKELDLSEQEFRISKSGAVEERVRLYDELKRIQEEYITGLNKVNDPASWYAQMNAINDTREALVQLNLKLKEQTGTLAEGMQYGIQQWLHDTKTGFEHGKTIAQDTANAMQDFFSGISFDTMQGKLKTLGDYFRSFITSMQRSVSQIFGQLATQGIMMGISALTATPTPGGPIMVHTGGYIPRFHAGGLSADEVPAILQRGEYVINRNAVAAVGRQTLDGINRGDSGRGGGGGDVYNISIPINNNFIDPSGIEKYKEVQERQIHSTIRKLQHENKI